MDVTIVWMLAGAALAGFVQGLSGFGFGLVAMSCWVWVLEPRLAAVLAVSGALAGQVIAACKVRRGLHVALVAPFVAGGLIGLPLGLAALPHLDAVRFRAGVGALLVVWCPLMLCSPRLPRLRAGGRWADAVAGAGGGFMGPLGGFTGAIPTLWCTLRGLERDAQRAVVQNFNLALLAATMAGYVATGAITRAMLPSVVLVAAALALPALAGMRVYAGISPQVFRTVVLVLLTLSGLAMLASALPRLP